MKTEQTKIPVEIATDYTHERGNETEQARQQIELSGFYLQSLFNSIKYLASDLESRVEEKEVEYCYDLRNLADIGYSVCNSIFAASSVIETDKPAANAQAETVKNEPENFDFGTLDEANTDTLALALSELLDNRNLPVPIYEAIMSAMCDMHSNADSEMINRLETSPEYLKAVFAAYVKRETRNDD